MILDLNICSTVFCSVPDNIILSASLTPNCKTDFLCSTRNLCIFYGSLISLLCSICIFDTQIPRFKQHLTRGTSFKIHISCDILEINMCSISSCMILVIFNVDFCFIASITLSRSCVPFNIALIRCTPDRNQDFSYGTRIRNARYLHCEGSFIDILGCDLYISGFRRLHRKCVCLQYDHFSCFVFCINMNNICSQ